MAPRVKPKTQPRGKQEFGGDAAIETPLPDLLKRLVIVLVVVISASILLFLGISFFSSTNRNGAPGGLEYSVTDKVFFDLEQAGKPIGRVILGLFGNEAPKTVANFKALVQGTESGASYKGSIFHRIVKGFMIQGGDYEKGDGTGGSSIYGKTFEDENLKMLHFPGALSMANRGPNTNSAQFFITVADADWLDGKHQVFGRVVDGFKLVKGINNVATGRKTNRPIEEIKIANCGLAE